MISTHTVFDADWYLARNPDVADAVAAGLISAIEHFELFGKTEGRAPGPLFDPEYYLSANADVAAAVEQGLMSAIEHFLQFGVSEDRSPLPIFDSAFYLARNPDIAVAVREGIMTPTEHFLLHGHGEPRLIDPFIDLGAYLRANTDVAEQYADSGLSPLTHLLTHGLNEGRELGNGIDLAIFANDPVFQRAVNSGDETAAIARVQEIAPFLPTFVPPAGWEAPADTPIPLDFVPPAGMKLVVPPSVQIPPGLELPPYFEVPESADPVAPVEPVEPTEPATPPDTTDPSGPETPPVPVPPTSPTEPDDDESDPPIEEKPTFEVRSNVGDSPGWSFHGTATGSITISTAENGIVSFTRQGITVITELDLNCWDPSKDVIKLEEGQILELSWEDTIRFGMAASEEGLGLAFDGDGTVLINTNDFQAESLDIPDSSEDEVPLVPLFLLTVAPTLSLEFSDGENTVKNVSVGSNVVLMLRPQHADDVSITGGGFTLVLNDGVLDLLAGVESGHLEQLLRGLGEDGPEERPVTLDIGTNGLFNVITATSGGDHITVKDGINLIYAGQGADQIVLGGNDRTDGQDLGHHNAIFIGVGVSGEDDEPAEARADSHWNQMDEIHHFKVGHDAIIPLPLYFNVADATEDYATRTYDGTGIEADGASAIAFTITDGIASITEGTVETVEQALSALSEQLCESRALVAYKHGDSTYLMLNDGKPGLAHTDMVVKLVGVTDFNHIEELLEPEIEPVMM